MRKLLSVIVTISLIVFCLNIEVHASNINNANDYEGSSNWVTTFFHNNPGALFLLIMAVFFYLLRVMMIDSILGHWNRKLDMYRQDGVYRKCMSAKDEATLESYYRYGSVSDYLNLSKWRIEHFINNDKLIQEIDDYLFNVGTEIE
jgi:hypothetical protein